MSLLNRNNNAGTVRPVSELVLEMLCLHETKVEQINISMSVCKSDLDEIQESDHCFTVSIHVLVLKHEKIEP